VSTLLRVVSWCIDAELENGERKSIATIPDDIAQLIDEYLSELEAN
tara:strand:+ start:12811 stop:12948 length:138 start_codon:yes stop_codon:yes gene_type:complete